LDGFYLIIPPKDRKCMQMEFMTYIEGLASFLGKKDKYYVSWFTASHYHGANHQMCFTHFFSVNDIPNILIDKPIEKRNKEQQKIISLDKEHYGISLVIPRINPSMHHCWEKTSCDASVS